MALTDSSSEDESSSSQISMRDYYESDNELSMEQCPNSSNSVHYVSLLEETFTVTEGNSVAIYLSNHPHPFIFTHTFKKSLFETKMKMLKHPIVVNSFQSILEFVISRVGPLKYDVDGRAQSQHVNSRNNNDNVGTDEEARFILTHGYDGVDIQRVFFSRVEGMCALTRCFAGETIRREFVLRPSN